MNPSTSKLTAERYSVTDAAGNTTTYTYDTIDELTGAVQTNSRGSQIASDSYGYDPVGNMNSIGGGAATFNADDELTGYAGHIYSHDANGNQTSSTSGNSFAYNAQDQTTSITPSGGSQISMAYTGAGQSGRIGNGTGIYQYDATGMGSTAATSTTTPTYFTTTPDGQVLSERVPGGQTGCSTGQGTYCGYYYLYDGQGSVSALVNSTGTTVDAYTYDPYGMPSETHPNGAPNVANPYAYIGAVWDSQESMYAMGDRYYDPSTGTFAQTDPMGGGFGYADGDPINESDPSGLCPWCVVGAAAAIAAGAVTGVDEAVLLGLVLGAAVVGAWEVGTVAGQIITQAMSKGGKQNNLPDWYTGPRHAPAKEAKEAAEKAVEEFFGKGWKHNREAKGWVKTIEKIVGPHGSNKYK